MKTLVDGFMAWQMIDQAGDVVQEGHQHNLLTDAGLDHFAEEDFTYCFAYIGVGDGNTPAAVTDTALVHEIARNPNPQIFNFYQKRVSDGVYRTAVTVEFDYNQANGNLQEWGLFPFGSSGTLTARELFRDGNGSPVVLTKTSAVKLRLTYTVQLSVSTVTPQPFSINIDGLGQRTGTYCFVDGQRQGDQVNGVLGGMFSGMSGYSAVVTAENVALTHEVMIGGYGGLRGVPLRAKPYVPGSHRRAYVLPLDTQDGNGVIRFMGTSGQYWMEGLVIRFDEGQEIPKDSSHKLTIDEAFSVSWGRGAAPVPVSVS